MKVKTDVGKVYLDDEVLKCHVCGGDQFWSKSSQIVPRSLNPDILNPFTIPTTVYVCSECNYLMTFYDGK